MGKEIRNAEGSLTYQHLGEVLSSSNVAAGATIGSSYYANKEWVRNMKIKVSCNQNYDLVIFTKDPSGVEDFGTPVASAQTATSGESFRTHNLVAGNGIAGHSIRFAVKNVGASPATRCKISVELLS